MTYFVDWSDNVHLPELLSPCASEETVKAAVYAGADAVYLGLTDFSARKFAKNLDNERLLKTVSFCHKNGVKVYVTMNTLILDREMQKALDQAFFLYNAKVDALIVADLGFAGLIHKYLPDFELHASTQASGDNANTARYLADIGFKRMVASRELSSRNLKKIVADSPIEIEMFVHGAICASHSGQCLMSSFIGGRSGNRGECAQPCRLPYNNAYPISFRDMCLAGHIKEILDISPSSLKIEGRMKGASYVYTVTGIYRKLLDEKRNASAKEIKLLADAFSRSGFTDGYFASRLDGAMLGIRTESDKENTKYFSFDIKNNAPRNTPIDIIRSKAEPVSVEKVSGKSVSSIKSARFYDASSIPDTDYFDIIYLPLEKYDPEKANGFMLPPFITDTDLNYIKDKAEKAVNSGAKHILISNVGQIEIVKSLGAELHIDYRLNILNSNSANIYDRFSDMIISPELTMPQIRDIHFNKSVIVYGKVPVMLLEKKVGANTLCDRKRVKFSVIEEYKRNLVLNSVPFYMADKMDDLKKCGVKNIHFIFTTENKDEVQKIIKAYIRQIPSSENIKRIK